MNIKQLLLALLCFASISLVVSCGEDDGLDPVGEDWITVDTKVYFIDSMTVKSSTFKFDSISVSSTSRLMVGGYADPVFGRLKAKSFMQFNYAFQSVSDEAVYDSIALILKYDNYFYNDTIPSQKVDVFNVLDNIETDDDYFYNTTSFEINPTSIGSKTFTPYPIKDDSLHITISNTFGNALYEKLKNNEITTSDEFLDQYRGILVSPDDNNSSVLGFSKSSVLRLYYSEDYEISNDDSETIDFSLNTVNSFHNVSSNYSGTYFDTLDSEETQLSNEASDNTVFVQSGSGLATRIDVPFIERINDIPGNGSILDANLKITIKQNSWTDNLPIRDSLNVYLVDRKGDIYSALTDASGSTVYGILEDSDSEFETLTYTVPASYFLSLKLEETYGDNLYLAFLGQDYNQSVERYILNSENTSSNDLKLKLELTYAIYEED